MSKGFKTRFSIEVHDIDRVTASNILQESFAYVPLQSRCSRGYGEVGYHWYGCPDECPDGPPADERCCDYCPYYMVPDYAIVPNGDWVVVNSAIQFGGPVCEYEWTCFDSLLGAAYVAAREQHSSMRRCAAGDNQPYIDYCEVWHLV